MKKETVNTRKTNKKQSKKVDYMPFKKKQKTKTTSLNTFAKDHTLKSNASHMVRFLASLSFFCVHVSCEPLVFFCGLLGSWFVVFCF